MTAEKEMQNTNLASDLLPHLVEGYTSSSAAESGYRLSLSSFGALCLLCSALPEVFGGLLLRTSSKLQVTEFCLVSVLCVVLENPKKSKFP